MENDMATRTNIRLHGTRDEAAGAVRALEAAGRPRADVSVVGGGHGGASGVVGKARSGTGRGAGIGATLGTLFGSGAGLMAGIGALPVPGAGPVVAAGWVVAVLTGAGVGAAIGAAAGGLLGSLTGAGVDEEDAHVHAEAARRGGAALSVRVEEPEAARPGSVLAHGGQVDVAARRAERRAEGLNRLDLAAPAHTAPHVQAERERRVRVYGASAAAEAAARNGAQAAQQGSHDTSDAPRRAAEATADAAHQGGEAGAARRVRVYRARTTADATVRRGAEAVQQGGRSAGDAPRRSARATADETTRHGAQASVENRRRTTQGTTARVEEVSREVAEAAPGAAEKAHRLTAPANADGRGPRDPQQGVTGLFGGVVQANLRVAQELFRLSNPAPIIELQQRFARDYTDALLRNSATLVRAVRRTADKTELWPKLGDG
jgi:hypothetical protein